jgi:radical SAM superfamily enzyme YgiQ (UPF0313 family)
VDVLFIDLPDDFTCPVNGWSLGFRYMISSLRSRGFSAELVHASVPDARTSLIEKIVRAGSAVVGFTTYDVQLSALFDFVRDLRRAGLRSHITLGGVCASAIPERILTDVQAADSVVFGEGEQAIVDLANRIIRSEGGDRIPGVCIRTGEGVERGEPRPLIEDLDSLPPPALDGVARCENSPEQYPFHGRVPVLGSRGCYGRCTFCCIQTYYRACPGPVWRQRQPAAVVDEIRQVTDLSGTTDVTFVDENFMGPGAMGRRHAVQIADELARRDMNIRFNFGCRPNDVERETFVKLKRTGLAGVTLGIESMGNEALALFNKRTTSEVNYRALAVLEELEIPTEITFIFFTPLTTLAEIHANLKFVDYVRQSRFAYFNNYQPFSEFVPFFGAELTQDLLAKKLVKRTPDGYSVRYGDPRVGFIAEQVLSVPVASIAKLRRRLDAASNRQSQEISAALDDSYFRLTMVKLPELAYNLLKAFESGDSQTSARVLSIVEEFESERRNIYSLVDTVCSAALRFTQPWIS